VTQDVFHHSWILREQLVLDPDDAKSTLHEVIASALVVVVHVVLTVMSAIQLNDQPQFEADEVGDKWTDGELTSKLVAIEAAAAKCAPDATLRLRRLVTHGASEVFELSGSLCHAQSMELR
jgi:hypothetical protein